MEDDDNDPNDNTNSDDDDNDDDNTIAQPDSTPTMESEKHGEANQQTATQPNKKKKAPTALF